MIVGVDVGTSVTKAQLIARDGRTGPAHEARSTLYTLPGNRVEQDMDEVIGTVVTVVRAAVADAAQFSPDEPVEALALTGQGDGLWLRDADGRPVGRALSWMDGRAADVLDAWAADGTAREVHRRTGAGMFPGAAGPLLAHLAEHEPERLAAADVAGYCVDAIAQRFTGARTVDASDASVPFLDAARRTYDDEALELCGLSRWRGLLAEPAPPGALFGLLPKVAAELGLPSGLPVSAGPFDIPACGFGSGLEQVGQGNLIIGTTLACQVLSSDPAPGAGDEAAGMVLATPYEDRYLRVMPAMIGTAGLDWLLGMLGVRIEELDALLARSPYGAAGVTALPFLSTSGERAPFVDARARGRLDGLSPLTSRADLVRALCEAVAYSARHCLETLGVDGAITACGGGARSGEWGRIFAGVLGRDVHVREDAVGIRGAARVAWRALGADAAAGSGGDGGGVAGPGGDGSRVARADAEAVAFYEDGYRRYLDTLETARRSW
ncbi:FGGY-family carbohydrate kinase [Streptomyces qinglanensis]|uniref:Xylulokinase/erythritol kinase n=1 Tax=Streptomyces qinglanensis TaxID=943816 RepID=A0A1H9WSV5_9ACTN|nr:FGGY-family carbohydrate kinase [Streptomyces qinglanensis]SES37020.1 xylulokinase/erythritol kinase [Streptomyces qinglanensis]